MTTQIPAAAHPFSCLLMDDDVGFVEMLAQEVRAQGGFPVLCHSVAEARRLVAQSLFDLAILDNRLPDGTGYQFYPELARRHPATVAIMITGAPELSQAVELTRNGLSDYLTKPLDASAFAACLQRARLRLRVSESGLPAGEIIGHSPGMREVRLQLEQAARHPGAGVLILGETGTGKDLAARELHRLTYGDSAAKAPYVALNCPNVPAEMFEAELFGSEKGAFTGADRRRTGLVGEAEGGTLFLDEVAEIPLQLQAKLLRFLESREYRALGSTGTLRFTGRVLAATNRNLSEEVRAGRFREDLLYRLDVFTIRLPSLREHLADIDPLAETLLVQLCAKYQRASLKLRPHDLETLRGHSFPGNVRELRNLLERSLLRTDASATHLAMDLQWLKGRGTPVAAFPAEPVPVTVPPPVVARELPPIEQQEYQLIAKVLREENGGIRRAATKLGLTHQALLRRLQKWPELRTLERPAGE